MTKKIYINIIAIGIVLATIFLIDVSYVNLLIAFLIIIALVFSNFNNSFKGLFKNNTSHLKLILLAFGYTTIILLLSQFIIKPFITYYTKIPFDYSAFDPIRGNFRVFTIMLFLGWFVGGLLEETIFRAFFIRVTENIFSEKIGTIIGVLISSTIFGYLHDYQGVSGQLFTGCIGFLLAIIYLLNKKNIWLNIYIHGLMNTVSFLVIYFELL